MSLVLVAHGTRRSAGRAVVGSVVAGVRAQLPEVAVRLAHVDVQSPFLPRVVARVRGDGSRLVLVPLLLSTGYHVDTDIAAVVDPAADVVTPTLAGDPVLVEIALDRLRGAGGVRLDAVVVAATGSSRPGARAEVAAFAADVGAVLGVPAHVGWAAGDAPDVGAAVTAATVRRGDRVGVVSYLIGPGVFAERARRAAIGAGAVAVGAPLGPDPRLVDLVVRRYRSA